MCPLINELKKCENISTLTILSGQHKDMVKPILDIFRLQPDYDLSIAQNSQTPQSITIKLLTSLKEIFKDFKPAIILIHGDTSTSFATALFCFYHHIPIAHIEAGLRTYDLQAPFPEEFNRQAISLIAKFHFAPTDRNKQNLIKEQKNPKNIFVVGNTAIDALKTTIKEDYHSEILDWVGKNKLIILTAHRRENIPYGLKCIFQAIKMLLQALPNLKIIYPIHPNPRIKEIAKECSLNSKNIKIIPPLDVIDFHNLLKHADLILTDSGGIQEEAPSLGKPVLILRDVTERIEGVEAGTLKLVGTDSQKIFEESLRLLGDPEAYQQIATIKNPYGDGYASQKIVTILQDYLASKNTAGGGAID
ncbi:UDP-N-acetylglucosamine 2-epimerase [Helicobacter sp. 11S02596-1]|nr:UDP-N-acetylglucosamine 2-epimerase [Helicobacter sp. 11S02596-1]